jgi:hypothetical protein
MLCMAHDQLDEGAMQPTLHDIVHNLTVARAHAELIAERYPEHHAAVSRFIEETYRAQKQLVLKLRPELSESLSDE